MKILRRIASGSFLLLLLTSCTTVAGSDSGTSTSSTTIKKANVQTFEATFQKHNIVFAGTMPKKPNSNMKKENGNMRCHSQAIIFLKATCPTLKHKNNNSDPYRIILKDVAKFANGHNCSKSRHLHEFKNWTDYKVPDLCNVANNPKR